MKKYIYFYTACFAFVMAAIFTIKAYLSGLEFDPVNGPYATAFTCVAILCCFLVKEANYQSTHHGE